MNFCFIILPSILFYTVIIYKSHLRISLIETRDIYNNTQYNFKYIENHFIIFHIKNRKYVNLSSKIYFIEHNTVYDDILFLIPLYSILIKTKIIMICKNYVHEKVANIFSFRRNNYTTSNNCIYFDITFLKYLHLHSNIFRFCRFDEVYNLFKSKRVIISNNSTVCASKKYSMNFTIVTSVYRRKNLIRQINSFLNQTVPPKYIIVIHDRNFINVLYNNLNIIYIHIINFIAGFYLRYLLSLLSPENDVIIYDDDDYPSNKQSHMKWIYNMNNGEKKFFGHRSGYKNGIKWCATPMIIHRKWLLLMWYIDIYDERIAEDGHLSFSLLLLCNVKCRKEGMNWLNHIKDKLSSSKHIIVSKKFWHEYTVEINKKINSSYSHKIISKYHIS